MRTFSEQEFEQLIKLSQALEKFIDIANDELESARFEIASADTKSLFDWVDETLKRAKSLAHVLNKDLLVPKK